MDGLVVKVFRIIVQVNSSLRLIENNIYKFKEQWSYKPNTIVLNYYLGISDSH